MNWLIWQQHRKQFMLFSVLVLAFAALTIPTGLHMWSAYQQALADCTKAGTCEALSESLFRRGFEHTLFLVVKAIMIAVPILLGIFLGLPLISREYTEGTNKFIWTQSVSRKTWLTAKLGWILGSTAVIAGAFTLLATWWSRAGNALYDDRFTPLSFAIQGIAPVGYAILAVALGIFIGAWLKRSFLALGVTFGVLLVLQLGIPLLVRPHYMPAKPTSLSLADHKGNPMDLPMIDSDSGAWVISGNITDVAGKSIDWTNPPTECRTSAARPGESLADRAKGEDLKPGDAIFGIPGSPAVSLLCLEKHHYTWSVTSQPSSRYWKFQAIETSLYMALASLCILATYRLVLRQDI